VVRSKPILLPADEIRVDDAAVPRDVDGVEAADRKQPIQRVWPRRHIRIDIDRRVAGFLDEITSEDHDPLAVITRHHYDEIRIGVAAPRVCDWHPAVSEVDDSVVDRVSGRPQGRDRAVDLAGIGTVIQRVGAELVGGRREVVKNLWRAVDVSLSEKSGTQNMIEVLVGQHHVCYPPSGELSHVGIDRVRFGERGTGVDEQHSGLTPHQTDGDVEKR